MLCIACGDDPDDNPVPETGTATSTDTDTDTDTGSDTDSGTTTTGTDSGTGGSDSGTDTGAGTDTDGGSGSVTLSEVGNDIPLKMGNYWKYENTIVLPDFSESSSEFEVLVDEEFIYEGKQYLKFFDMWIHISGTEYFELFQADGVYHERKIFEEDLENGDSWESDEIQMDNGDKIYVKYIQKNPCYDTQFTDVPYTCVKRFDAETYVNGSYQIPTRIWFIKPGIGIIRESLPTQSASDSDLLEYELQ